MLWFSDPMASTLCSRLKLLRHGLVCRHYFAVLVRFLDSKFKGVLLDHRFNGNSVHARWRQSLDGNDEPWTVSRVLQQAGYKKIAACPPSQPPHFDP